MAFSRLYRLRALILVLAFALIGQAIAPAAMTMQPGNRSMADMSMKSSDMCPGCADNDHSAAVLVHCVVGLCAGVVGILPMPTQVTPALRVPYAATVFQGERGITIPPDPAPPRFPHLV